MEEVLLEDFTAGVFLAMEGADALVAAKESKTSKRGSNDPLFS